jgi:hypothetical protein
VVLCKLAYDNNMPTARIMNSFMEKKYNYIGNRKIRLCNCLVGAVVLMVG